MDFAFSRLTPDMKGGQAGRQSGHNTGVRVTPIPIQSQASQTASAAACPGCLPGTQDSPCAANLGAARTSPLQTQGPQALLEPVLAALRGALSPLSAPEVDPLRVVDRLSIDGGEATVVLNVPRHCAGARLSDAAFQALRQQLPDTDIYILHQT